LGTPITSAGAIGSAVKASDGKGVASHVVNAIQRASYTTGVDFSYLMQKASQESSFDPTAKASTSTATGLFQFTSQTWLHMVKDYGDQHGLSEYAAQIKKDSSGKLSVENSAARQAILALRKDPQISAVMAGELDKENAAILKKKVGGEIGRTELYLAHFLGASGASNFIKQMRSNPSAVAADVLPTAASSNHSVFYSKSGEARSLRQIYQHFAQKFDAPSSGTAYASNKKSPIGLAVADAGSLAQSSINYRIEGVAGAKDKAIEGSTSLASNYGISSFVDKQVGETMSLASLESDAVFSAMLIGQIKGHGLDPVSSYDDNADTRKKVAAYTALS